MFTIFFVSVVRKRAKKMVHRSWSIQMVRQRTTRLGFGKSDDAHGLVCNIFMWASIQFWCNCQWSLNFFFPLQMIYTFDPSQMTFLRLLSDRARQNITYHCRNSAAWFNKENSDYTHSIKIMGDNGIELHASSSNKFKPTIIRDDCHVSMH